jgi:uncharacterized protein (TIRG00374 family)
MKGSFDSHFLAALAVWTLALVFEAYRWQAMLNPRRRVSLFFALKLDALNRLANLVLPLRAGEALRVLATRKQTGMSASYVLATIVNERVLNILLLGIMALVLTWILPELAPFRLPVLLFNTAWVAGAWWYLRRPTKGASQPKVSLEIQSGVKTRLTGHLQNFIQGAFILREPKVLLRVTVGSVASGCGMGLALYLMLQSYQPTQPALAAATLWLAMNAATILPLTPSSLGPLQWACILSLSIFGVGRTEALAFSMVLMTLRVLAVLIVGLIGTIGPLLSGPRRRAAQRVIDFEGQQPDVPSREYSFCESLK